MPTRAQIETSVNDLIRILNEFLNYSAESDATGEQHFARRGSQGSTSHEEQFLTNLQADYSFSRELTGEVELFRSSLQAVLARAPGLLTPGIREYGKFINAPETDPRDILNRLYDNFITNAQRVQSRSFTFGTPLAATFNVGTGDVYRLNLDENTLDIENQTPESKTAVCVADEHSGATVEEEVFEFRGQDAERDGIVIVGSGRKKLITALSARHSLDFISNPSFSEFDGTVSAPTAITDWTIFAGAIADLAIEQSNVYRGFEGDSTPSALRFDGNVIICQPFITRRLTVDPKVPMYLSLAIYRPTTATTGFINITAGNGFISQSLAGLTPGSWNTLRVFAPTNYPGNDTLSQQAWYKNFALGTANPNESLDIQITALPTGEFVLIDDIIFAPMTEFDGGWYAISGGSSTVEGTTGSTSSSQFRRDDEFTWTDSATEIGLIQKWLWRAFGVYLPHTTTTGSITWVDPV